MLAPFAGFTVDTGLCAASLIMDGVPERFPGLRIGFSHGGGVLAPLLHRMEFGWGSTNGFEGKLPQSPKAYARRFFYDSLVYDEAYLEHLATHIAPDQICLGTDYPYLIQQPDPRGFIAAAAARPGVAETIWSDAARRFLGVPEPALAVSAVAMADGAAPPKPPSKSEATRQSILHAAAGLFRQQGYAAVSLRDIAEAVGMKTGSLYYHFSSKESLVEEILSARHPGRVRRLQGRGGGARGQPPIRSTSSRRWSWPIPASSTTRRISPAPT